MTFVSRAGKRSNAPYICRITEKGRQLVATGNEGGQPRRQTDLHCTIDVSLGQAEQYMRRAMEAERKAATASSEARKDMLDAAMQWRELAEQVALLASLDRAKLER